jgi:hypothetical protein
MRSLMPHDHSDPGLVTARRTNALNPIEKMRQNALMFQQTRIIKLTSPTIIGDIASFPHRVPECDLQWRVLQNDFSGFGHACTLATLRELPSEVVPPIIAIPHHSCNKSLRHLYYATLSRLYSAAALPHWAPK